LSTNSLPLSRELLSTVTTAGVLQEPIDGQAARV
jgi:hypothetical protein